jgi:GntR family transcriptional repressor for pyruvate dehydrogenase complex
MSRTDRVVEKITQMILDGELSAGDRLPIEKDLAANLEVSRGSLREGVRALTLLGVLTTRQGDGTYVTSLDAGLLLGPMGLLVELQGAGNALHIHSVRRLMETEAAGLAALNIGGKGSTDATSAALWRARDSLRNGAAILATPQIEHELLLQADVAFHRAVSEMTGNPVLVALIAAFASRTARARLWRALAHEGAEQSMQRDHELILKAIVEQDPEGARIRMAAHLLDVEDSVGSAVGEQLEPRQNAVPDRA